MAAKPLVRLEGLTRRYGGLIAVSDLTMEVHPAEILGLIGPNGAGKSTTYNLISGFVKPTSGQLYIHEENVTGKSPTYISKLGLIRTFQHSSLMKTLTVHDNILIGAIGGLSFLHTRKCLARVQDVAALLGLDTYLNEISGNLSHGIQRLVSIAIAFAAHPKILCLDEPLTGLNQTEATSTLRVLRRIRDEFNCSILLVEHNMKAVMQVCDRIIVLHQGKLLAAGTPEEIRNNSDVISAYLGPKNA